MDLASTLEGAEASDVRVSERVEGGRGVVEGAATGDMANVWDECQECQERRTGL